ncbi:DUF2304 family protein [Candidatus Woesearchaeota archaeon]|nr:DUF2304 family protein [Candidatus Woesearchaeota archaeon]
MEIIQVLVIIFAVYLIVKVIFNFKREKISLSEFIFWEILWILLIILAVFPRNFNTIAEKIGVSSIFNLIVYISIILLFFLIYKLYIKSEEQREEITKLVREITLKKKK